MAGMSYEDIQDILLDYKKLAKEQNKIIEQFRSALEQIAHADDSSLIEHPHEMAEIARKALEL